MNKEVKSILKIIEILFLMCISFVGVLLVGIGGTTINIYYGQNGKKIELMISICSVIIGIIIVYITDKMFDKIKIENI